MIEVLKPGIFTTLQDLGRPGWQSQGVPEGGAIDRMALRVANLILGNREDAVGLECTLRGPVLRFSEPGWIAVTGARVAGFPWLRPRAVVGGEVLDLEEILGGARMYVGFAGGLEVPRVLDSASALVSSGWEGMAGRVLRAGDVIELRTPEMLPSRLQRSWSVSARLFPPMTNPAVLRAIPGPQAEWFSPHAHRIWQEQVFEVSLRSNRMGLRLQGTPVLRTAGPELVSEAVAFGSVQVPADGQPIVLSADRQTLGGYPKIANVISADRSVVAQLRPGGHVRFVLVSPESAHDLVVRQESALASLRAGLAAIA